MTLLMPFIVNRGNGSGDPHSIHIPPANIALGRMNCRLTHTTTSAVTKTKKQTNMGTPPLKSISPSYTRHRQHPGKHATGVLLVLVGEICLKRASCGVLPIKSCLKHLRNDQQSS